ncbi:MAG: glycoside hydrolase family 88 protein [Acidobacteriota bacterium]|nr:glycoside hydrolase family 88 protein [Acidobacteriota bacterium]
MTNRCVSLLLTVSSALLGADRISIGLTASKTVIGAITIPAPSDRRPRVLLIGGLAGNDASVKIVQFEIARFESGAAKRRKFHLTGVALANPDKVHLVFPPSGQAYRDNPESHYLWRWIATEAPDLVLVVAPDEFHLARALSQEIVAGVGRIPARIVEAKPGILKSVPPAVPPSEARLEIERRVARAPRVVAEELARVYGHDFETPVYIPGMALIGRLRLGARADVEHLAAPYVDGSKDSLAKATSSHLAGHLVFAELAERTGDRRYLDRVLAAANLAFTESGEMKPAMPLHNEMSDAVFMGCPILAKAGKLTGERKYFDMAQRHLAFMQKLCLRPDGIYRHSPLNEAPWGRGNAFPALGLALTLSDFPKDHPGFGDMLRSFQNHMAALAQYQQPNGMWRQVLDQPGAYSEFSATAMIAVAMLRGIGAGWLDAASYQPRVDRAWQAILARTSSDGRLTDVCESTGKQKSLDDYLHRTAILDRDPRGGAMALLLATEVAGLH